MIKYIKRTEYVAEKSSKLALKLKSSTTCSYWNSHDCQLSVVQSKKNVLFSDRPFNQLINIFLSEILQR